MSKAIIFQASFLVSGIMCFEGCGNTIQNSIQHCIKKLTEQQILPADVRLIIDAEPHGLGIHKLTIALENQAPNFVFKNEFASLIEARIRAEILEFFNVLEGQGENEGHADQEKNWINILVNCASMVAVMILTLAFPPSLFLTIGLAVLSLSASAFSARDYIRAFFRNLRTQNFADMATTISLGWFLSTAHTLFHAFSMPLASSFSMVFMSFMMPTLLMACINGMDEVKRILIEQSKKIQIRGLKTLFPEMSETYCCYRPTVTELALLKKKLALSNPSELSQKEQDALLDLLNTPIIAEEKRSLLTEGCLIEVQAGACFPTDCILIKGHTSINASVLTGESQQDKTAWQSIPSGAINLGQKVTVYTEKNPYNSTVNALLFCSNGGAQSFASEDKSIPKFVYFYAVLIAVGLIAVTSIPIMLGVATVPLVMQSIVGILFSVCPCTIAIAHQLPKLIYLHQLSTKGIQLRNESLITSRFSEIHTVVFDKTGTLTTGNSIVESSTIPKSSPLWQRIYLLEKIYGKEHFLAKVVQKYFETEVRQSILIKTVDQCVLDPKNRGLSAQVQEKNIRIGSFDYLRDCQVRGLTEPEKSKIEQGFSAIHVAEEGEYRGVIYIKHEMRSEIVNALPQLKKQGKKIIMLTGDQWLSAQGFNKQIGSIFDERDIHAGQTPEDKATFLKNLLDKEDVDPRGLWFICDGLNDAQACGVLSGKGVSCAVDSTDKSAFFADISLNRSLNYLFKHNKLKHFLQENIYQNKGLLIYSTLVFLAFIMSFSLAGIAVSPLIPMTIMLTTTFFVVFNSYRTQCNVDLILDEKKTKCKKLLGSNLSIGLLLLASTLLVSSALMATLATGGLALPITVFASSSILVWSGLCTLSACTVLCLFASLVVLSYLPEVCRTCVDEAPKSRAIHPEASSPISDAGPDIESKQKDSFFLGHALRKRGGTDAKTPSYLQGDPLAIQSDLDGASVLNCK